MNLKELQKQSKNTIEENAKLLGMPKSTYNNYIIGYRLPNLKTSIKLANFFDVSLDYLCNRQWKNKIGHIPEDRSETIQSVINLSDEKFQQVKNFVEFVINKEE